MGKTTLVNWTSSAYFGLLQKRWKKRYEVGVNPPYRDEVSQEPQEMFASSPTGAARDIQPERLFLVCIVGSSPTLADACRVSLEQLCPGGYQMQECGFSHAPSGCDIYIWDFESSPSLPAAMVAAKQATKVVIANKSSLSSVRRRLRPADFTYLQSPVTPHSLRAVLESAIARPQLRRDEGKGLSRLRLDRERVLLQTNLQLREQDQDRTNFLMRAIHDLRVPLMATQGYCDLFLAGQLGSLDAEQTGIMERMQRSLTRLCRLLEAMMDLGAGSQVTNKLRLEPAGIEACVQQAVHEVLPFVEDKQINLNVDVQAPNGTVLFDSGQLEQVLVNLLDNACKFTPKRGSITVGGRSITAQGLGQVGLLEATAGYRIDITDSGRGIDPAHIEQIFDEHTSYSDPMDRSGWGLGLAICRMIIQAHHGRIWANSSTQGASFSLVLPLASTITT
jgi:signal transduction histidine kinase